MDVTGGMEHIPASCFECPYQGQDTGRDDMFRCYHPLNGDHGDVVGKWEATPPPPQCPLKQFMQTETPAPEAAPETAVPTAIDDTPKPDFCAEDLDFTRDIQRQIEELRGKLIVANTTPTNPNRRGVCTIDRTKAIEALELAEDHLQDEITEHCGKN